MKKTTKGVIAGLTGVALLTSGGTFALWNYQGENRPGVIYTGDMSITAPYGAEWFDQKSGNDINPETFRASPGDRLMLNIPLMVKATGTNARPALNVELGTTAEKLAQAGATANFSVFNATSGVPVAANVPAGSKLSASMPATPSGSSSTMYNLQVNIGIDENSTNASTNQLIDLGAIVYSLTQLPDEEAE